MSGLTRETDPWSPWPSNERQVAMSLAVPPGLHSVCDCHADEPGHEATNPDDRSQRLPHHFDCAAVTAWAVAERILTARLADWQEAAVKFSDDYHAELDRRIAAESRLAAVEALADEWERMGACCGSCCINELRAALGTAAQDGEVGAE